MFSQKQQTVINDFKNGKLKRINLLEGSVRSGKTWISLVMWALWVATMPKDSEFLMVAKTVTSLNRNCLNLLQTLIGVDNFTFVLSKKEARLFGRLVYLEGVNDMRAEGKIRGMTLSGAYCDEVALFTEDFFTMLLSRLSEKNAKLFATTNPDNPNHWVMKKYIERSDEIDIYVIKFLIQDNTFLDPEYVKQLMIEYTGVYYDRYILGLWCVAEGVIYDMYDPLVHLVDEYKARDTEQMTRILYKTVCVDYGTSNPTVFLMLDHTDDGCVYLSKEYYWDSKQKQRQKTDAEYSKDLALFLDGVQPKNILIDPSATSFMLQLKRDGFNNVRQANNVVLDGIRNVSRLFATGTLYIMRGKAPNTEKELVSYSWNAKAAESGEDRPIKENDHCLDALRYGLVDHGVKFNLGITNIRR